MTVLDIQEGALSWESASPGETERMGEMLGSRLCPGDLVACVGELGSGKTVLVRGIAAGLGCSRGDVHSPSFTLVNEYPCGAAGAESSGSRSGVRLVHLDLYRIHSDEELPGIGWDAYVHARDIVVVVEWADRAMRWLPRDHVRISLETLGEDRRRLRAQGVGPRSAHLVLGWVKDGDFTLEWV